MTAAALIGSSIFGAGASIYGANKAAKAQTSATDKATATQLAMFGVARAGLQPFIDTGSGAANKLTANLDALTRPISITNGDIANTPGYGFIREQGMKAVSNMANARGFSGGALKEGAEFATGLADQTYNTRFNEARQNREDAFNKLYNTAGLGANAATGQSSAAIATGSNIGSNAIGAGNAQAGAATSTGNSLASAFSDIGSIPLINKLLKGSSGGMYGS